MHADSSPRKFRADLVLCRSKRKGCGSPEVIEAAKMHLAMLALMTSKGAG